MNHMINVKATIQHTRKSLRGYEHVIEKRICMRLEHPQRYKPFVGFIP